MPPAHTAKTPGETPAFLVKVKGTFLSWKVYVLNRGVWGSSQFLFFLFFSADPALKPVQVTKLYYQGRILKNLRENLSLCPKELE